MYLILLLLPCFVVSLGEEIQNYEGFKVYQIHPNSVPDLVFLKGLEDSLYIDYWAFPRNLQRPVVALADPEHHERLELLLLDKGMKWSYLIEDVQKIVKTEQFLQSKSRPVDKGRISFTEYHRYGTIQDYVRQIAANHAIASHSVIGKSTEGRDLDLLSICKDTCGTKPAIFIECGIHAREWIAPAMCLYIIQELVENQSNSVLSDNVDWFIVPVMNVDGYEYTHTTSRFWRKTRSLGALCNGVDANRNFNHHWMEIGASSNECSETFAGLEADSEPEVRAIESVVIDKLNEIKLYLAIHSYGQYMLHPWGYTGMPSEQELALAEAGTRAAEAIWAYAGTNYTVGSFYDALYPAAGSSMDWVMGIANIGLSYTVELPGGGSSGFDLPPSRIDSVVKETWQGVTEFHTYVEENYVKN